MAAEQRFPVMMLRYEPDQWHVFLGMSVMFDAQAEAKCIKLYKFFLKSIPTLRQISHYNFF